MLEAALAETSSRRAPPSLWIKGDTFLPPNPDAFVPVSFLSIYRCGARLDLGGHHFSAVDHVLPLPGNYGYVPRLGARDWAREVLRRLTDYFWFSCYGHCIGKVPEPRPALKINMEFGCIGLLLELLSAGDKMT